MKFFSYIFGFCLFFHGIASAHLHLGPCQFGLQGELLYLKPMTLTLFGVQTNNPTNDTVLFNTPDYKPGWRVEGLDKRGPR